MDSTQIVECNSWKFFLGDCEAAWVKGYANKGWETAMLPHDRSVRSLFSKDYSSGTGYLRGGYRLVPASF